jgi:hypothetical protein
VARAASTATNTSRIALIVLACSLLAPVNVTYYFVVRAHSVDFLFSDPSNEVSGIPTNSAPSVLNPG